MTTTQIIGATIGNTMEVEAATKAARVTLRDFDYAAYGANGIYSMAGVSGLMAAGLATAVPIWSFRWSPGSDSSQYALVRRIVFSAGNDSTAFTAGLVLFNLFVARSFTASDTGGTALTPSSNQNKLRTSMGPSVVADARIASTGTLTAGTRALDGDPIAALICGVPAVAGSVMIPPTPFFDQRPGEYPLVLAPNEGLVIQSGGVAIAATGTWKFAVKIDWAESSQQP